jgi:NADPH2 dehydrogenase
MAGLFSPIRLAGQELPNRILVSPMCQYSAEDGQAVEWHFAHYGALANSGAAMLVVEATAVEERGRISLGDLGLYSDACEAALGRIVDYARRYGTTAMGVQLAHAGRKASAHVPWAGGGPLKPEEGAWATIGPSALPFDEGWHTPHEMTPDDLEAVKAAFVRSAEQSLRIGFELIELHMAHGYLLREFCSAVSNRRTDAYGGSAENRLRFPLEVAAAVRAVWPEDRILGARITGSDWLDGAMTEDDAVRLATALKEVGLDYVCVSSGGISPLARVRVGLPGAVRPPCEARERHRHLCGGPDRRPGSGRADHRRGRGRPRGPGPRLPRQPALGLGRGARAGGGGPPPTAICAGSAETLAGGRDLARPGLSRSGTKSDTGPSCRLS